MHGVILSGLTASYSAAVDVVEGLGLLVGAPAGDEAAHGRWEAAVLDLGRLVGFEPDEDPAGDVIEVGMASGERVAWALRAAGVHAELLIPETPAAFEDDRAEAWRGLAVEAGVVLDPAWC